MGYWTISESTQGYHEAKGSKFYAYLVPLPDSEAVRAWIQYWRAQHPKASHVCYAYRLGVHQVETKAYDDGEPANTAGQPILNHLTGRSITQVLLGVVRYFGGTKLGKGGLITAYGQAAKAALEAATFTWKPEYVELEVNLPYTAYPVVLETLKNANISIVQQEYFSENCRLIIAVPKTSLDEWQSWLDKYLVKS
jgi:uncharacterized YigZ family protein